MEVLNGHTFRADPLSTRTIGTLFPVVITVMSKAFLWFSFGRSLSVKVGYNIVFAIRMWEIIWTSWDGEVSNDTCLWPSEYSKDRITVALRCHAWGPYGNVRLSLLQLLNYFIIFFRHLGFLFGLSLRRWVIRSLLCRLSYFPPRVMCRASSCMRKSISSLVPYWSSSSESIHKDAGRGFRSVGSASL